MSIEQSWLIAMWAKVYDEFCKPRPGDESSWLLSIPDTGGLRPVDEYFLSFPKPSDQAPDAADVMERLDGNADFAYATNFVPHFAGVRGSDDTVWAAFERVFGQVGEREAKFGLPKALVDTPEGALLAAQREWLLEPLTAPDARLYRETLLSVPRAMFEPSTPWRRIAIKAGELSSILAVAPDFLKRMIGVADGEESAGLLDLVEEISFEISTATIVRPWLDLTQLVRPLWDWILPGTPPLSDGGSPPQGSLPAIPERIVFARNAEVKLKPRPLEPAAQAQGLMPQLQFLPFMFADLKVAKLADTQPAPVLPADKLVIRSWLVSSQNRIALTNNPKVKVLDSSEVKRNKLKLEGLRRAVTAEQTATGQSRTLAGGVALKAERLDVEPLQPKSALKPGAKVAPLRPLPVDTGPIRPLPRPAPPPRPTPITPRPSEPAPAGFRDVQILAFLCRPLPRLPNPHPDLVY
jgi:hypothetical protein